MNKNLSTKAQKLVELCGPGDDEKDKISIAQALKEHPELLSGLDEYIEYREKRAKDVERRTVSPKIQHGLAKKLRTYPQKKQIQKIGHRNTTNASHQK